MKVSVLPFPLRVAGLVLLAANGALLLGCLPSAAQAQSQSYDGQRRPIAITNVPGKDVEDLDLGPRQGEALRGSGDSEADGEGGRAEAQGCSAPLASGAVAGQRDPKGGCEERSLARAQYDLATDWAHALWCHDPLGRKAGSRGAVQRRLSEQKNLLDAREDALRREQARLARQESEKSKPLAPLATLAELISGTPPKAQEKRIPIPPAPYYDASGDAALAWDAREAGVCGQSPYLPPELAPSIAQAAQGRITTAQGSCDAILVESTILSGRHAQSRLSWIASRCSGYVGPDAKQMAEAVAGGDAAARAWQKEHLLAWKWSGGPPREAKARSADAP